MLHLYHAEKRAHSVHPLERRASVEPVVRARSRARVHVTLDHHVFHLLVEARPRVASDGVVPRVRAERARRQHLAPARVGAGVGVPQLSVGEQLVLEQPAGVGRGVRQHAARADLAYASARGRPRHEAVGAFTP